MSWTIRQTGKSVADMRFAEVPSKQRPRFAHGHTYTPARTRVFENAIHLQWEQQVGAHMCAFDGPVKVSIDVERPLSKSNPRSWAGRSDLMKPDADNVAKAICDALNGLAYKDDSQIIDLHVRYLPRIPYGMDVRVRVEIAYFKESE